MLVLSRHPQQRIRIGSNIIITIASVHGDRVKVGIDAPPEVRIARDELPPDDDPQGPKARPVAA